MRRGELYRVRRPGGDPKRSRIFVVVSRQAVIDSRFSTVVCAPVFTRGADLATQVAVGVDEGLKRESWIMCDNLVSVAKTQLTDHVGSLGPAKLDRLERSLRIALDLS